ncbi:MAG: hypothetical protein HN849_07635 [Victivallales bacterium]|nr:hypothetical protein [Victivallales bacterium]
MTEQKTQEALVVSTLEVIGEEIDQLVGVGYRATQRIAVLVSEAKEYHFETVPGWQGWCSERFGYAKRTAYDLAKVGCFLRRLLPSARVVAGCASHDAQTESGGLVVLTGRSEEPLLGCGIQKLACLAELYEQKPDQFLGLLERWDPAEHTREQVRAKVRTFLGEVLHKLRCDDCHEEFEASDPRRKRCVDCEAKHQAKLEEQKERRKEGAFERALVLIAGLWDQDDLLAPLVADLAPGMGFRGAMTLLDLVGAHVTEFHDLDRGQMEGLLEELDKATEKLRKLTAEASE